MTKWMANNYFFVKKSDFMKSDFIKSDFMTKKKSYFHAPSHNIEMWKLLVILASGYYHRNISMSLDRRRIKGKW